MRSGCTISSSCRERFWLGHGLDFDATYQIGCIDVRTPHIIVALARYHLELSPFPFFWLGRGLQSVPAFQSGCITIFTPHNILLAALLRGGVFGLLSLAAALLGAMAATVAAARRGWWLPVIVLASSLALSTVDHEMVPGLFGFYWYLFWLPLGLAAAAALTPPANHRRRGRCNDPWEARQTMRTADSAAGEFSWWT